MREAFLATVEIDRSDALAAFQKRDGNMHARCGFARAAFFVANDDDVSGLWYADHGLNQHDADPVTVFIFGAEHDAVKTGVPCKAKFGYERARLLCA
jgi:hypothetical protein